MPPLGVGGICVAATYKSSGISLQFIAEGELEVVTVVPELFGIVSSDSTFLVAFHIDHTAVAINGDDFEFALLQQLYEDLEVNFSSRSTLRAACGLFCS